MEIKGEWQGTLHKKSNRKNDWLLAAMCGSDCFCAFQIYQQSEILPLKLHQTSRAE